MGETVLEGDSNVAQQCQNLIAYFSMEIGFQNEIPTYSGGLGVLAGDTVKSFADLKINTIAITLLSEKGYFYQRFDEQDHQQEDDYEWSPEHILTKLDTKVSLEIEGRTVAVAVWMYELVGITGHKVPLYFLDTNLPENDEQDRNITSHLYGGDMNYRLKQEMVLGIAGVKVIRALGLYPKKYHLNEGHAAFLVTELYKELQYLDTEEERMRTIRSLCSFTTHTPVPAGHDAFEKAKVLSYFGNHLAQHVIEQACDGEKFIMTKLALNHASYVNAVSQKHQQVTKNLFPGYDIDYITNGVHSLTWVGKHHAALFDRYILDWRKNPLELRKAHAISLDDIQKTHTKAKQELIDFVNTTMNAGLEYDAFTIGFARRATGYKRADLIFSDIERLKNISKKVGKIQLIFSGKAHPRDEQGKLIIQKIRHMIKNLAPAIKLVFIDNYNMYVGQLITSGVDLWLNTPQRPLEASGTSGMKAAHNGVPSLSVPDGWWIEGLIEGMTGWGINGEIIPSAVHNDQIDKEDAQSIYDALEMIILPLYYSNPKGYAKVMRNAIAINASYFNTHRMVKQYLIRAYTRELK